jgi:hypothetical protein
MLHVPQLVCSEDIILLGWGRRKAGRDNHDLVVNKYIDR